MPPLTEADTCRKYVVPKLLRAGWDSETHSIVRKRRFVSYLHGSQTQVEALQRLQTEIAAELDALLPSILDRAFKGQL
jgi:type I site-specific restriction endonuclease